MKTHKRIPKIKKAEYTDGKIVVIFDNDETRYLIPDFFPNDAHLQRIRQPHIWPYIAFDTHSIIWTKYILFDEPFEIGNNSVYLYSKPLDS